jgi:hypothetical protein
MNIVSLLVARKADVNAQDRWHKVWHCCCIDAQRVRRDLDHYRVGRWCVDCTS